MPAVLRERSVRVHGVGSPVIEAGPAEAREAAVFVHGNPGSSRDWERLVSAVGEHGRAVALDMPGFGRADKPPDFDYTVGGYATFLAGALRELGVERAHIVGHDFGGPFRARVGGREPRLVRERRDDQHGRAARLSLARARPDLAVAARRRTLPGHRHPVWLQALAAPRDPARAAPRFHRPDVRRLRPGDAAGGAPLYRSTPPDFGGALAPRLHELDRPALVVWGAADPYIPVEQAERQRESFPHAQVVVLERSGHWPFVDDPEAVERRVVPFLRERFAAQPQAWQPKAANRPRD